MEILMDSHFIVAIFEGWVAYQRTIADTLKPLGTEHLALRAAPKLRSIGQNAEHIIGTRARWFYLMMGEGGEEFNKLGKWDRRGSKARSAEELVSGLERTWEGMQEAIHRWTPKDWKKTWPGEGDSEPETITRQWVIWHLIEHDLQHGGEISITLEAHGIKGFVI